MSIKKEVESLRRQALLLLKIIDNYVTHKASLTHTPRQISLTSIRSIKP